MQKMGRAALHDLVGDFILFRSLEPLDPRLRGLAELYQNLQLQKNYIPRKREPEYGLVVSEILKNAHNLIQPDSVLDTLLYIGDTPGSDLQAFRNICQAGNWAGIAFIGKDVPQPGQIVIRKSGNRIEIQAESWFTLKQLFQILDEEEFMVGENTVVLIDIDKTILGARGRNDHLINQARIEAVRNTLATALGKKFVREEFETSYQEFNQNKYHFFTADNQDVLAYICLIVGSDLITRKTLIEGLKEEFEGFDIFLNWVEEHRSRLNDDLRDLHDRFFQRVRTGDPTPFKEFRREEFRQTVQRMGTADLSLPASELLNAEIVITGEVYYAARQLAEQGAVLFGLSDKPDEATLPEVDHPGQLPLHRIQTHVIGSGGR
jgi:hypothetical protein